MFPRPALRTASTRLAPALLALPLAVLSACEAPKTASQDASQPLGAARLYPGFERYGRSIATTSERAQEFVDQGLQWLYGFNDDEAIRCFREAARLDPEAAFPWWGIAYASGINVNDPVMSEAESQLAWEALGEAVARRERAAPVERELIDALARRYGRAEGGEFQTFEQAYADAMAQVWRRHGDDADVGALYAESLMNLQPWDYWTIEGEPKGRASELVAVLERVLELEPEHPGALHYYIHAVEASRDPARAEAAADRLAHLVPGSSHLSHMPSHIYARLGRYQDAADANARAVAADRSYLASAPEQDYYGLYIAHNLHFLAYASMMEGRFETALQAARELETQVPRTFVERYPEIADGWLAAAPHVLVRFGRWQEIFDLPEYPAGRPISAAMRLYARSIACSAQGRTEQARAEMEAFDGVAKTVPIDWTIGFNPAHSVFPIARKLMLGELLFREGDHEQAFRLLREAAEIEDRMTYDEPPSWLQPTRHALGALLTAAGRAAEAEVVYEEDLARNPRNGWSLLGLEQARRAQRKNAGLDELVRQRKAAWSRADVTPTSSCYCEPGALELAAATCPPPGA